MSIGYTFGTNKDYEVASNRQPSTDNYLLNNSFKFSIDRIPYVTYFCQKANIPSLDFGIVEQPTKYGTRLQLAGTLYDFSVLEISFIVDENMKNWLEIFDWMKSMGSMENFTENVSKKQQQTDAEMIIMSSAYRPILSVQYKGVFPVNIGGIDFDSAVADPEPVLATATFQYRSYDIVPLNT
jgi:hypothetical protein